MLDIGLITRVLEKANTLTEAREFLGLIKASWGTPALDPGFRAEGLGMVLCRDGKKDVVIPDVAAFNASLEMLKGERDRWAVYNVTYDGLFSWTAVETFFRLNSRQAQYLFSSDRYDGTATAAAVADRIREVLQDGFPAYCNDEDEED